MFLKALVLCQVSHLQDLLVPILISLAPEINPVIFRIHWVKLMILIPFELFLAVFIFRFDLRGILLLLAVFFIVPLIRRFLLLRPFTKIFAANFLLLSWILWILFNILELSHIPILAISYRWTNFRWLPNWGLSRVRKGFTSELSSKS